MITAFSSKFNKDIRNLRNNKGVLDDIYNSIVNVESVSQLKEIKNFKKIVGSKNHYRIKIGDYRIGILIKNNVVEFLRVAHRKDIYKAFP